MFRPLVNHYQQHQHSEEDDRRQRSQLRRQSPLAGIGVYIGGERLQPFVPDGEDGHRKVVDGEGEGEDEAAHHPRQYLGQDDLAQRLERSGAQVERRFVDILVHLLQTGHHAQHHVGRAEGDVRQYHRDKSLRHAEADEQQEQGYAGNDVGIHHRDGIGEVHHLPGARAQVEDADGCYAPQGCGGGGGNPRDGKRVEDGAHQRVVHASGEERGVQSGGEARPVAQHLGLGEGEYQDNQDGGVEQRQQYPQVTLGEYACHRHITPPLSLDAPSSSLVKRMVMPISSSMMSDRAAP